MKQVTIVRLSTGDEGTFGRLETEGYGCLTLELPWRENQRGVSCILPGSYPAVWALSPRFGACYHVENVPGRSDILIHSGNFAGDKSKGLKSDVEGCILLGRVLGKLSGQRVILQSRAARDAFAEHMGKEPFTLTIKEEYGTFPAVS